jgi:hypothetical protein
MKVQIGIRRVNLMPFSSAVISAFLSLAGAFLLTRLIWREPAGHIWSIAGFSLLLVLLLFQLWRIHRLYEAVDEAAIAKEPLLRKAVNETLRTFNWGNVLFLLLALAVFQFVKL